MKKTRKFLLTFLFAAAFTVSAVPCRTEAMELPAAAEDGVNLFSTPSNKSLAFSGLSAKITESSAVNEEVIRSEP